MPTGEIGRGGNVQGFHGSASRRESPTDLEIIMKVSRDLSRTKLGHQIEHFIYDELSTEK